MDTLPYEAGSSARQAAIHVEPSHFFIAIVIPSSVSQVQDVAVALEAGSTMLGCIFLFEVIRKFPAI